MAFFERRHLHAFAADVERVRAEVLAGDPKSLLDLGGGDGAVTWAIANGIPRVVIVEPQNAKRARGAKRHPGIEFHDGSGEKIPMPDGSLESVISFVAFHHFHNQAASLREIRRVLQPGGRLVLFELRPEMAPGPFWRLFAGHTHFLEPEELLRLVSEAGFAGAVTRETPAGYFVAATR